MKNPFTAYRSARFGGGGTKSQVPCRIRAVNSWDMAVHQCGSERACLTQVGSMGSARGCLVVVFNCLGLKMLFRDRVVMGWVREMGGLTGRLRADGVGDVEVDG